MFGWGGRECDGLVSNTLSLLVSATSAHPSMVSHSPVCFKAIVFVATSISVLVLLCCPSFFPLSNPILIGNCDLMVACTMSCVCVGLVGVCCVMSSDGVRGVDDAVCLIVHSQKKATQHTALFACDGVHQCIVLYSVWGECERVVGAGEKRETQKHTVKQKQKGLFPKPLFSLFSFFHLFFFHSFLLAFHFSTITLLIHTLTSFPCFTHECIRGESKTPMTQHLVLFIVFSFCPNSIFLFFSFIGRLNADAITIKYYQIIK